MPEQNNPTLVEWSIIKISLASNPEVTLFSFTGIGYGHPRLQDSFQFVTTAIQEVGEDETWGRSRSRVYNLTQPLNRREFSPELAELVREIIQQRVGRAVDVEWTSVEDWRRVTKRVSEE